MIEVFGKGIQNRLEDDKISSGASSNSLGWRTKETSIELVRGKLLIGEEETSNNKVLGLHTAYKPDGTAVMFRKVNTVIQYYNTMTLLWVDVITGLTDGAEYTFSDYSSLAGVFVYITGVDGCFKIHPSYPADYIDLTNTTKSPTGTSDYGRSMISNARMFAWGLEKAKTNLYLSYIDSINYTTITDEVIGSGDGVTKTFSGSLLQVGTGSRQTGFAITFTDGAETFSDDQNGVLTGDAGGTGTINYTTGAYSVTFNTAPTSGTDNVLSTYQYEASNNGGITDFTFSSPRTAGQGDFFPQELGGSEIQNVLPKDGSYYSIKDSSVYKLFLSADDTNATNEVFNGNIGSLSSGSSTLTSQGIVLLDTSNPEDPRLNILSYNITGDKLIPNQLAILFKFSDYEWDECKMDTFGEDIIFTGKKNSSVNNRLFRYNMRLKTLDVHRYSANSFTKDDGKLYIGDSATANVYEVFSGFDDDGFVIDNYWDGKAERFSTEYLKRYRKQILKGFIGRDQSIEVYISYDNGDYKLVETLSGTASYVDLNNSITVGSREIGEREIGGGGTGTTAYYFFTSFKVNSPKFGKRKLRFKATGLGHAQITFIDEKNLQLSAHSKKIPYKYR